MGGDTALDSAKYKPTFSFNLTRGYVHLSLYPLSTYGRQSKNMGVVQLTKCEHTCKLSQVLTDKSFSLHTHTLNTLCRANPCNRDYQSKHKQIVAGSEKEKKFERKWQRYLECKSQRERKKE